MAIVENVQRSDLNPIDRAKAFERLLIEFNLSNSQVAERVSKSTSYVSNTIRLLKLPDALKDGLLTGLISEGHARALSAIEDPRAMVEAYKIILKESGSVRRAEELSRRFKHATGQKTTPNNVNLKLFVSEEIDRMQNDMTRVLGHHSTVKLKQSKRETKLLITMKGSPEELDPFVKGLYHAVSGLQVEKQPAE
jgi:ParB family chromosome partitioning protein